MPEDALHKNTKIVPLTRIAVLFCAPDSDITLYIEPVDAHLYSPMLCPLTAAQAGQLIEYLNMQLRHPEETNE